MKYLNRIEKKLKENFSPTFLEVVDESNQHAGHVGSRPGGETHFKVSMSSIRFKGLSRVQRQRAVYKVLEEELNERVHALSLTLWIE